MVACMPAAAVGTGRPGEAQNVFLKKKDLLSEGEKSNVFPEQWGKEVG